MSSFGRVPSFRSCSHLRENSQRDDLLDDAQRLDIGLHTVIRNLVGRQAFLIERAKTGFVAEERTVLNVGDALEQFLDGALQPNEDGASLTQQHEILRLRSGTAAEGDDARFLLFDRFADDALELGVFNFAEFRFAEPGKYFGDGLFRDFDDAFIEVHMLPADLAAQQARDGGLAAAHEADQADERARASVSGHRCSFCGERANQSRLIMLIVPSKEVNSILARPSLKVPNRALPQRGMKWRWWGEGVNFASLFTLPFREVALRSKESPGEKRTSITPL